MIPARSNVSFYRVIRDESYTYNMFSIGPILPVSFSVLQACLTVTILLSRDSTCFSLSDTASKSALTRSDAQSSEVITVTTPSRPMLLSTNNPSILPPPLRAPPLPEPSRSSLDLPLLPPPLPSTSAPGLSNTPSRPLAPLTSLRLMTKNARVRDLRWTTANVEDWDLRWTTVRSAHKVALHQRPRR